MSHSTKSHCAGFLLVESVVYLFLSSLLLTLLMQLVLGLYQQSRQLAQRQIGINNLWAASDVVKRDILALPLPVQLADLPWRLDVAQQQLYRRSAAQERCLAEQVQEFQVRLLASQLAEIRLSLRGEQGRSYRLTRLVYLPNTKKL